MIIFNTLKKYIKQNYTRFDVPGHKGKYYDNEFVKYFGEEIVHSDVNSLKMLDNINNPKGIIMQSQLEIAKLHGADNSKFLLNGTTFGIQVMVLSCVNPGDKILIPRNVHRSVLSAIILSGAIPLYFDIEFDSKLGIYTKLNLNKLKQKISNYKDIKAALLINPSYYGISNDFQEVVSFLKKHKILVLVDEAHGGHLYLLNNSLKDAMSVGADMSCISYHKTLGSLTQTSLLIYKYNNVDEKRINEVYAMLNTTSSSYLLMSNIEVVVHDIFLNKKKMFENHLINLNVVKEELNLINGINVLDYKYFNIKENEFDKFRLLIDVSGLQISGFEVYEFLRDKYKIQVELGEYNIILGIVSIFDTTQDYKNLINAMQNIANEYTGESNDKLGVIYQSSQDILKSPREIFYSSKEYVNFQHCEGRILGDNLMLYPPGIAIFNAGEVITEKLIREIENLLNKGEVIHGMDDDKFCVIINSFDS